MREIGVRKLKASLSEVLRAVQAGESVRVTVHGKPVADIVPPKRTSMEDRLNELAALGWVTRATKPHSPPPPRYLRPRGAISGSDQIIAEREAEDRRWERD